MDFRGMGKSGGSGGDDGGASGLVRQPSVYALTLEEFQSTLGTSKDFGSMNMDELLRSIWTAEEAQAMAGLAVSGSGAAVTGLQRQPSLTLPRTLSQKTVDEVWKDLFRNGAALPENPPSDQPVQSMQRQPTLGEMTLEEFLYRAGLVREEPERTAMNGSSLLYGEAPMVNTAPRIFLSNGPPVAAGGNISLNGSNSLQQQMEMVPGRVTVAAPPPASRLHADDGGRGNDDSSSVSSEMGMRGRRHGGGLERVVERRQRRMIKNRESAARSRARKQAYTMELEAEIAKLKETNANLRKKQELMLTQKNQALEKINHPKKQCLRRTLTGPW